MYRQQTLAHVVVLTCPRPYVPLFLLIYPKLPSADTNRMFLWSCVLMLSSLCSVKVHLPIVFKFYPNLLSTDTNLLMLLPFLCSIQFYLQQVLTLCSCFNVLPKSAFNKHKPYVLVLTSRCSFVLIYLLFYQNSPSRTTTTTFPDTPTEVFPAPSLPTHLPPSFVSASKP